MTFDLAYDRDQMYLIMPVVFIQCDLSGLFDPGILMLFLFPLLLLLLALFLSCTLTCFFVLFFFLVFIVFFMSHPVPPLSDKISKRRTTCTLHCDSPIVCVFYRYLYLMEQINV